MSLQEMLRNSCLEKGKVHASILLFFSIIFHLPLVISVIGPGSNRYQDFVHAKVVLRLKYYNISTDVSLL